MESKFVMEQKSSLKYIELQNFPTFFKWLECKVKDTMSNLMEWFNDFYLAKDKTNWIVEVVELWDKVTWWAKFSTNLLKKRAQLAPWMEKIVRNLLSQIES
jgi:hypothetical protein